MKFYGTILATVMTITLLSGCAQPLGSSGAPSLSPNSRPTSRMPSPGNTQRSTLMQSSTMMTPR